MQPYARAFDEKSQPLSFLAAVLFVVGITDLVSISMPEEIAQYHWGSQGKVAEKSIVETKAKEPITAPVRLLLFGGLTTYSVIFSASSPLYSSSTYHVNSWSEGLKNRVVFTWAFLEMVTWFWAFLTLREERQAIAIRLAEKRAAEEDMM